MPSGSQRQDWDDLSAVDPYWAILSDRDRRFGRWDQTAFIQSGRDEVDALLADGARFGLPVARVEALDFGCGAGRLTQAIARDFQSCLGLDVSGRMIGEARGLAQDVQNCDFAVHDAPDLAPLQTARFDLVVSRLVLQHIAQSESKERYIAEFVRVLRPGGLLALQLPSHIPALHRIQLRPRLYGVLRRAGVSRTTLYERLRLHPIRMSALPSSRVLEVIDAAGGQTLEVRRQPVAGGVISSDYLATKSDTRS
ncbi:MAG TPA: class I SAM-dependent methyltransferase [Solirubrobacteraceae bacterium]|nr:class I SAM-dependent methyltransferase [Solirubrobacteraceae bacterium]